MLNENDPYKLFSISKKTDLLCILRKQEYVIKLMVITAIAQII